jgi:hypothetical protein
MVFSTVGQGKPITTSDVDLIGFLLLGEGMGQKYCSDAAGAEHR